MEFGEDVLCDISLFLGGGVVKVVKIDVELFVYLVV